MLPNLIVIGAMKAGTSSLHYYLSLHPEIFMSEVKELNFFERNWEKGLAWYESQFPTERAIRGESSPNYAKFPTFGGVPQRMHSILPDAKLIYVVRDPIERIVSHYIDAYSYGRANGTISEALADFENHHIVKCSKYFMQLEQYLEYYDASKLLIITSEDLKNRRPETMRTIFRFLGVTDSFYTIDFDRELNGAPGRRRSSRLAYSLENVVERVRGSRLRRYLPKALARPIRAYSTMTARQIDRPELEEELRQRLIAYLRADVDQLRSVTGRTFQEWCV